jgi:hypothetical protein
MVASAAKTTSPVPFEMGCECFHPTRCAQSLCADSVSRMVDAAIAHGALAHGFTPAFYSREKRAAMAAEAARYLSSVHPVRTR